MEKYLAWIESQHDRMVDLVHRWASINSGTFHTAGVTQMAHAAHAEFLSLDSQAHLVDVAGIEQIDGRGEPIVHALGPALSARCRSGAPRRVLLVIHTDTVYPVDSEFQTVRRDETQLKMFGPGVADAKGGIVVMLVALQALERFVADAGAVELGWEVMLNPDEEIGSPGSEPLLREAATRNHVGLLFEPALPTGQLVGSRKGSANFHIRCRGKSAHAGRHFHEGRNAIAAAAEMAMRIDALNGTWEETTLNVGKIDGGGPVNIVPDVAVLRFNVRYSKQEFETSILSAIDEITSTIGHQREVIVERFGDFNTPPKQTAGATEQMLQQIQHCGRNLGLQLEWQPTGGVCDGNRLAAWGVPNVDTLGVRGADIHSHNEHMTMDSLTERAKLTASLMIGWAAGEIGWPV